jgi:hypothetical protein
MSFLKTTFFIKNLPAWERTLRIAIAIAVIAIGLIALSSPWSWIVALGGVGFGFTGLVGFCPMCALVGRRLAKRT